MFLFPILLLLPAVLTDRSPPRYRIQLDSPPSSRWNHVVDAHMQSIKMMHDEFPIIPSLEGTVQEATKNIQTYFPREYGQEMQGIASRANMSLDNIVRTQIYYDMMAYERKHAAFLGCTSIVACDEKGRILHGRNMDYEGGDRLKNNTVIVDFYRGRKFLYTGVTFLGYVGLLTGLSPDRFSVSLNARFAGNSSQNAEMAKLLKFHNIVGFVIRDALEHDKTYARAVDRLSDTPLIGGAYIIVGGVKPFEGAVITRDRLAPHDVQHLSESRWFLTQSNVDNWTGDVDSRSILATKLLSEMGRSRINVQSLFGVMSTPPIRNNITDYSGVMSAAKPSTFYDTFVIVDY